MAGKAADSTRGFMITILGAGMLLCCGVPIGTGYFYLKDSGDEPGMRAAGQAYLTAVVHGENETAYDLLCESDRRKQPRATWEPVRDRRTTPTGFRITAVTVTRQRGPTERAVTADITYASHPTTEVNLYVEKQDGAWKVCNPPLL